jgi:hypothetical protein
MEMQKQIQKEQEVSSIRISHKAKSKLAKIGARMTLKDGKQHSMEEVIDILMESYDKDHKNE